MSELFYGNFYGFESAPFQPAPDASLLFATETHQQALGVIEYGIVSGKGFIVVTGEVGVGKTTVLRACLDRLDSSKFKIIYVFNPDLKPLALYKTILEELETSSTRPVRPVNTLHRLQRALLTAHQAGYQIILAIDEAQNMPEATLEGLRLLSNLETPVSKLMQIVLVGQPELEAVLSKHTMRQLAQRIAVRATIRSLTLRQSRQYILHRLQCAGRSAGRPLFTVGALWYIAFASRGIPRAINILCDNALISGYADAAERLSLRKVREACRPLRIHARSHLGGRAAVVTLLLVTLAVGASYLGLREKSSINIGHDNRAGYPVMISGAVSSGGGPIATATATATEVPVQKVAAVMLPAANQSKHKPGSFEGQPALWKWLVRSGDTVTKLCRMSYGQCDENTLQSIYKFNPQIGSDHMIVVGEVIVIPERDPAETPN